MLKLETKNIIQLPVNYLELNWLSKKDKDISLPNIVFDKIDASGYYFKPQKIEILLNDKFYSLDKGLIVVNDCYQDDEIINTIAHEWRHHLQFYKGFKFDSVGWNYNNDNYRDEIINYFTKSKNEMDALFYSNYIAHSQTSLEWCEWILQSNLLKNNV